MKKSSLLLLMIMCLSIMSAQTWIRSYSIDGVCPYEYNGYDPRAYNVIPAIGGGYLLQGFVEFYNYEFYVMAANVFWNVDENGDVVWRRYSGQQMQAYDIIASNGLDRYYCISSYALITRMDVFDNQLNFINSYDFWDINGFPASLNDAVITDDGIVFAGKINGYAVVLKTDFEFNLVWQGDIVVPSISSGYVTIEPYNDGWIAGSNRHFSYMSATGDTLWNYYAQPTISFNECLVTQDNHIICSGLTSYMGGAYVFMYEMDPANNEVTRLAEGIHWDGAEALEALVETSNGDLVLLSFAVNGSVLHGYNRAGEHLWSRDYFPNSFHFLGKGASILLATSDGGTIFCTNGNGGYSAGITLVKTDSNGEVSNADPILIPPAIRTSHYPNPAGTQVTIDYKTESQAGELSLEIFNIRGQLVHSSPLTGSEGSHQISLAQASGSQFAPGVYLYRITDKHFSTSISKRFIITK